MKQDEQSLDSIFKKYSTRFFVALLGFLFVCSSLIFMEARNFVKDIKIVSGGEIDCRDELSEVNANLSASDARIILLESKVKDLEDRLDATNKSCLSVINNCYPGLSANVNPVNN